MSYLVAIFLIAAGMRAEDYRGRVQGIVTDASEAAVPGATVTLKNVDTGIENVKQTDSAGWYLFDLVPPGTYSVSVKAAGFQNFLEENIPLLTRGDVTVNATLKVGTVSETVTVSATATGVELNTASMTTTVQGSMLKDIPILARNPFTLALLDPAVVNRYWDIAHREPFYMSATGGMDVGGPAGGKLEQLMDGTPLNVSGRGAYNASMDVVQEVAVQQNPMDSEYGFSAGAAINLSTKSGTNEYHGVLYGLQSSPERPDQPHYPRCGRRPE